MKICATNGPSPPPATPTTEKHNLSGILSLNSSPVARERDSVDTTHPRTAPFTCGPPGKTSQKTTSLEDP